MARRIGFLTSADMMKERTGAREDWIEFDLEFAALEQACAEAGHRIESLIWDQPFEAGGFDVFIVGTVWDYPQKQAAFHETIERLEARAPVLNPPAVVRWNADKGYLQALAEAGAPSLPTRWADRAGADEIAAAFAAFDCEEVVVKPRVGAGAWRQARVRKDAPTPSADQLPPGACLIQPFLPSIPKEGEYSFMYFGGRLSHALVKRPGAGDYRVQSMYGATEHVHRPDAHERALADRVLQAGCAILGEETLLYARVDMARGLDGDLAVMELELIEPYFYPEQGPETGVNFVRALEAKLASL